MFYPIDIPMVVKAKVDTLKSILSMDTDQLQNFVNNVTFKYSRFINIEFDRLKLMYDIISKDPTAYNDLSDFEKVAIAKSVRENDLKARGIVAELEDLASRKDLIDSWQSIEGIKLIGDYSLQDVIRIVEGKESLFEAKQENDKILNRGDANIIDKYSQGGDAELDTEIEAALEAMRNKNA